MASSSWTEAFPGWEHGSYHGHTGVYRRRPDGLSIRVLRHEPPTPCPEELGGAWPEERSWMLSFWRLRDSQSFHLVGPDASTLSDVLSMENVSVATLLVELNKRGAVQAWAADLSGFQWTGELEGGATPPDRAPADWLDTLLASGWTRLRVGTEDLAERRLGPLVVRVGIDRADDAADYTPQCWFMEFGKVDQQPLRRVFGGEETVTAAGELYFTPWRDTRMVLDFVAGLRPGTGVDEIRSWLQASTDAAVEFLPTRSG